MRSETMMMSLISIIMANLLPFFGEAFHKCINNGNYSSNSTYKANLDTLLYTLPTNIDPYGFYHASVGQPPDQANVIVLCRGDVDSNECRRCVQDADVELTNLCPYQKQAISSHNECMLRYSNEAIFGTLDTSSSQFWAWNAYLATSPDQFNQVLELLLSDIKNQAVNGGSHRKFGAGNITGPDSQTIFALVQCTPDLNSLDCNSCLTSAIAQIPRCCDKRRGGRVVLPSCNIRFEIYPFFNESRQGEGRVPLPPTSDESAPQPPVLSPTGTGVSNKAKILSIASPISACLIIIVVVVFVGALLKMRGKQEPITPQVKNESSSIESLQYAFSTIRAATNDFSNSNKLGQGGFGAVYKGLLPNGQEVAIKRLSNDSAQGSTEFKNEVVFLARLEHKNLVKLLGFSIQGREKLLVYEYIPNGSLDTFIFDSVNHKHLDWDTRYKIISGIARGLVYLHENARLKIIHRDIKPGNILLDQDMNSKIADFGMAKLFGQDETEQNTRRIAGTLGYMPPEYAREGRFSVKSDVFSFGVLVLQIINGQKEGYVDNQNEEYGGNLLSFAWENWRHGTPVNIVDPFLKSNLRSMNDVLRCIQIGLLCVQKNASDRPAMASVVLMLGTSTVTLGVPSEPAFYFNSSGSNTPSKVEEDELISQNDVTITEFAPR